MSTVIILTPIIIANWPVIAAAVGSAAAAMGMSAAGSVRDKQPAKASTTNTVEVELEESQALAETVGGAEEIALIKGSIRLRVRRNEHGRCTVCAEGEGHTEEELRAVADEFSQKMTQSFVYNKVTSELKAKGFQIVNEEMAEDDSVRIHVRRWEG